MTCHDFNESIQCADSLSPLPVCSGWGFWYFPAWMECCAKQPGATGAKQEATNLVQWQSCSFLFRARPQAWWNSKRPEIKLLRSSLLMKYVGQLFLDSLLHNLYIFVWVFDLGVADRQPYTMLFWPNQIKKISFKKYYFFLIKILFKNLFNGENNIKKKPPKLK